MAEHPDFEQIARRVAEQHADRWDENGDGDIVEIAADEDDLTADIVKALRQVWNARGKADVKAVFDVYKSEYHSSHDYELALRKLDR